MTPGTTVHRLARLTCTRERCDRILEPALADLQYDWSISRSWKALVRIYAVFWQLWATCLLQDTLAAESRLFTTAALTAFALVVAATALLEAVLMHGSMEIRHLIVSSFHSRLVSAAMFDTATLRYGVPFAIGPAAVYARWRISRIPPAAYLTAAMFAMSITTLSSGWIAPILIRHHMTRQHDRFARWAAHAPSSSTQGWYVPPVDFSAFQPAKPWPELIVSAAEPPRHAFAMTPRYVAPGEKERPAADRREIIERLSLVVIAVASAVVGTIIGGLGHARASVNATEATSDAQ